MTRRRFFTAMLALAATAAAASQPEQPPRLQFQLESNGRRIHGESRELEWNLLALSDGSLSVRFLVPFDSLVSSDAGFDAALRKASEASGHPYLAVEGMARNGYFEGTLRAGEVTKKIALPLETQRADGFLTATVTARVEPSKCGIALPGQAALTLTFRLPASGNAVLAGGSVRPVN